MIKGVSTWRKDSASYKRKTTNHFLQKRRQLILQGNSTWNELASREIGDPRWDITVRLHVNKRLYLHVTSIGEVELKVATTTWQVRG